MNIFKNKTYLWPRFFKKKRKSKKKSKTTLSVKAAPKKHMTEPDHWTPPFETKKSSSRKKGKQDLVVVNELSNFDLGRVTATIGIMLQIRIDSAFEFFINECLERFKDLDWGGITESERRLNEQRIATRTGIVCGIYTDLRSGIQIWVATNFDEGVTKICLSEER